MLDAMVQFGVAGLMGVLWVWERAHSRQRERQLTEAHHRIVNQNEALTTLIKLARQNTRAVVGFERTQRRVCDILQEIRHELARDPRSD
ncbi:MAG: hypothetical protein CMJ49_13235 [Planctomycetaceae bacterium]|nr:hypothetical protein [Planctomycetaceae bacterium]